MRATPPSDYDKDHCDFLEKLIRQPIFSAIDLLRVKRFGGNYPSQDGRILSKKECCHLYTEEFPLGPRYNKFIFNYGNENEISMVFTETRRKNFNGLYRVVRRD